LVSFSFSPPTKATLDTGDVLLHTPVEESCQAEDGSYDFSSLFANVKDEVHSCLSHPDSVNMASNIIGIFFIFTSYESNA